MKKFLIFSLLFLFTLVIPASNRSVGFNHGFTNTPQTLRDYSIERGLRIFPISKEFIRIIDISIEEGVNPLEVLAYMKIENCRLNPTAKNENVVYDWVKKKDGWKKVGIVLSTDRGVGQINSTYQSLFVRLFWKNETEKFNVYNSEHNIKISIRLFKSLKKDLKDSSLAVMAYNAGIGSVLKNRVPEVTRNKYLPLWLKYMKIMEEDERFVFRVRLSQ